MKIVGTNRKANHLYEILDTYEAGIVLSGSEVKSLRQSGVSLGDAYAEIKDGEIFLFNLHIAPYKFSSFSPPDPARKRKLLLKKEEIKKLYGVIQQKGNSLIPLKVYFNERGFAKVTLGVCRRKRAFDRKGEILEKEARRKLTQIRKAIR